MQEIKSGRFFGYVYCDLKVPEHLKTYFTKVPPIFKNTVVSRNDIRHLLKKYGEKKDHATTKKNAHVKLPTKEWNYHHSLTIILLAYGS